MTDTSAPSAITSPIRALDLLDRPGALLVGVPCGDPAESLADAVIEADAFGPVAVGEDCTADLLDSSDPCVRLVGTRKGSPQRFVYEAVTSNGAAPAGEPAAVPLDSDGPWSGVALVSPATAEAWLGRNTDNRPLSRATVRRYAGLMGGGRWLVSADAIAFDTSGKLVNGQHRLHAVIEHGGAVPMLVACGLSPAVFAVLDTGKQRSGADVLAIRGFAYASTCAAVVRSVAQAEAGGLYSTSGRMELDDLVRRAEASRADIEADCAEAAALADRGLASGRVLVKSHAALLLHAFRQIGEPERMAATEYMERVAVGVGITATDDPAHVIRQALLDDQRADVPMGRAERLALLTRGALHAAEGRSMKRARGRGAEAWPSLSVPGWLQQRAPGGAPPADPEAIAA